MPTNQQAAFHRGASKHQHFEDTEWQANGFASALLMPANGLAVLEKRFGQISAAMIQDTFNVSYEAASYRLGCFTRRKGELLRSSLFRG
jgi:Zn-dependent peptidase ImmA (M78 family)